MRAPRVVALLGVLAACGGEAPAPERAEHAAPPAGLAVDGWVDITAVLAPGRTPVYEGDAPLRVETLKDMRRGDALTLSALAMGAHTGTHVDAPRHFVRDGVGIDGIPLARFIGPARVLRIDDSVQAITRAELDRHDWRGATRLLFRTRSSTRGWMDSVAFTRDFTFIAPDAADALADAGVQLVGVDYLSAEQFGAAEPRTHQRLLGRGIPIVEGLDLRLAPAGDCDVVILPLRLAGLDGAPARAILRPRVAR
ncbi:MAG: cyclase family protein [Gemmatimonadaceae bacterium]|jgi:arylformamidase|nr:cyclase family protein [Gemmatimonadaceae bacterium]